jgi:hypothetical protein
MSASFHTSGAGLSKAAARVVRVILALMAATVLGLMVRAVTQSLGWDQENQQTVIDRVVLNSILAVSLAWAFRKRLFKGVIFYLAGLYLVVSVLIAATIGLALFSQLIPQLAGVETTVVIDQCKPDGHEFQCSGQITGTKVGPSDSVILWLRSSRDKGEVVRGTFYTGPFGGFAEGSHAPTRPPFLKSILLAVALLTGTVLFVRFVWAALRAEEGLPIWEPGESIFHKPVTETVFRYAGLAGAVIVAGV